MTMMFDRLTERERQCLRLIGRAMSHKEVARELDLSDATVKEYLAGARRKLGATTTREAARALLLAEAVAAPLQNGGAPKKGDAAATAFASSGGHVAEVARRSTLPPAAHLAGVAAPSDDDRAQPLGAARDRRAAAEAGAPVFVPAAGHDLPGADRSVVDRHVRPGGLGAGDGGATEWGGGSNDLGLLKKLGWAALIMIVSLMAYGGFTQGLRNMAAALPLSH